MSSKDGGFLNALAFAIFLFLEILLAGAFKGSADVVERVNGRGQEACARTSIALLGSAAYMIVFFVSWKLMALQGMIEEELVFVGILLGAALGFEIFWLLDRHIFPRIDLGNRAIFAATTVGIPVLVMGTVLDGRYALWSLLFMAPAGLLASLWFVSKCFGTGESEDKAKALCSTWTLGAFSGGVYGYAATRGLAGFLKYAVIGVHFASVTVLSMYGATFIIAKASAPIIRYLLVRKRFSEIVCNNCCRYTVPLKSRYELGTRYCEHCNRPVERTHDEGKVIFAFGGCPPKGGGREFVFWNPDCAKDPRVVDVSEVYIESDAADPVLLEHFVVHVREVAPPKNGCKKIRVLHKGPLEMMGKNMANLIRNNFSDITEVK